MEESGGRRGRGKRDERRRVALLLETHAVDWRMEKGDKSSSRAKPKPKEGVYGLTRLE